MRYLKVFLITLVILWGSAAGINWFVDPYGMYWSPVVEGVNQLKPESGNRVRTTKPFRVKQVEPSTLLVGNSRIEMGIQAESSLLKALPVYNLGMPGVSLKVQLDNASKQLIHNTNLTHIILSLDYLDFLFGAAHWRKFEENPEYLLPIEDEPLTTKKAKELLGYLFSLDTTFNSFTTIAKQSGNYNAITLLGTNHADSYRSVMRFEGIKPLFVQKIDELRNRLSSTKSSVSKAGIKGNPGIKMLKRFLANASDKNVKVTLFISPYHYSYLHVLEEVGHWDQFLLWKEMLAKSMPESGSMFAVWDFSGFSKFTLEQVNISKPNELMNWYWEPAHYRAELGEHILETIFNDKQVSGFSRAITSDNLQQYLAQDREGLKASQKQWLSLRSFLYGQ